MIVNDLQEFGRMRVILNFINKAIGSPARQISFAGKIVDEVFGADCVRQVESAFQIKVKNRSLFHVILQEPQNRGFANVARAQQEQNFLLLKSRGYLSQNVTADKCGHFRSLLYVLREILRRFFTQFRKNLQKCNKKVESRL